MSHDGLGSLSSDVQTRLLDLPSDVLSSSGLGDPAILARALLGEPGRTGDADVLTTLGSALLGLGFVVRELQVGRGGEARRTLLARIGRGAPHVGFAAHVGAGESTDMTGAVAGFVAAVARMQKERGCTGTISLLLTTEAANAATPGIAAISQWMVDHAELPDLCIVGAPTSRARLGDVIKIGCRGQLHGVITVQGRAGHTACPELADNPVSRLLRFLARLDEAHLDHGSAHFPPSSLTITTVDVGNQATHVIPGSASAAFEIRYNDHHTRDSLESWLRRLAVAQLGPGHQIELHGTGDTPVKPPGALSEAMCAAISAVTGHGPAIDTGSLDAGVRFMRRHCPVVEFGPRCETMHEADEQVALAELEALTRVYQAVLTRLFAEDGRSRRIGGRHDTVQGTPGRISPSAVFSSISARAQTTAQAV